MREEDGPAVADVIVELDGTVGGVGLEVGSKGAEAKAREASSQWTSMVQWTGKGRTEQCVLQPL